MTQNKKALACESYVPTNIIPQNNGYIKVFRDMIAWEWFTDINVAHLFLYCLLRANHTDTEWRGIKIKRGSFLTSLENLAKSTGLTIRQVRTALNKLKTTHELTHESTSQYSIITVNNWSSYQQSDTQADKQMTNERQTNDKRATTDNNDKNEKNIYRPQNKKFQKPTLEEVQAYCLERGNNVDASKFIDYYESKGWIVGKSPMKDWQASVRTWENNNKTYQIQNNQSYGKEYYEQPYNPML